MILIINGSFGVGKTTVGHLLRRQITGSCLYNPEWAGSILMRLPFEIKLKGSGTDDFQDIELWRKSVVYGTKLLRATACRIVIVPMAFSRIDYFDEIISQMRNFDDQVKVYCLRAGIETILKRLEQRGEKFESKTGEWIIQKAHKCINAHQDTRFGEPVDTEGRNAAEVANEICRRLENINKV
jgi:hypothetical protein